MAEHESSYQFTPVAANDILEDRQSEWQRFTKFVTWGIGVVVAILVLMAIFLT